MDGRVLAQEGKWVIPLDLQQWPKSLPNRGLLELDVLQLPIQKVPWMACGNIHIYSTFAAQAQAPQEQQQLPHTGPKAAVDEFVREMSQAGATQLAANEIQGEVGAALVSLHHINQEAAAVDDDVGASKIYEAASVAVQPDLPLV